MRSHITSNNESVHPLAEDDGRTVVSLRELGKTDDAAATTDAGTFSLMALFKRLLGKLPASVGQKMAAGSLPVILASDQTLPLPAGAATESTLVSVNGKMPANLGQKTSSASLAVVLASDQSAVNVATVAVRSTATATIPSGASVSGVVDLGNATLVGFIAPAAWTAAALNIEVSADNANWATLGLFDLFGVASGSYPSLVAGAAYATDAQTLMPFRYVRMRSGTAASPVNQGAARDFTLVQRALA